MRHIIISLLLLTSITAGAQTTAPLNGDSIQRSEALVLISQRSDALDLKLFSHLDLSLTAGTTGIGLDLSTPVTSWLDVRAGIAALPHFDYNMNFEVKVGNDPATSKSKFKRLSGLLESFTGYKVDNKVKMIGQPLDYTLSLMFDVKPFTNKNWHLTAGFFLGPEKFAKAVNATEDMVSLVAVGIYNNIYDRIAKKLSDPNYFEQRSFAEVLDDIEILKQMGFDASSIDVLNKVGVGEDNPLREAYDKIYNYGRMGIHVGNYTHDVLYEEDVYYESDIYYSDYLFDDEGNMVHSPFDIEHHKGDVKYHKGDVKYHKGDPYMMEPNSDSMVKADFRVNYFRPYLGFGYGGQLSKKDDRWRISFDCGAMFWGGTPRIVTHEGVNLCKDVEKISGDVGHYVRFFKQFKAYPVLNVRITRRLSF